MEINVTSRETIKPSKPTPPENKTFNLCSLDILYRNTYFPIILFYPPTPTNLNIGKILKQSLSETLSIFYPIAGRRKDLVSVACNDEGATYYEAIVNGSISDFLNPPILESLNKLLPCDDPYKIHPPEKSSSLPHLMVQVNTFECGGVAIGVCCLHTILDAGSCGTLLRAWSAICRDRRDEIPWPDFNCAFSLFPPMDFSRLRAGVVSASMKEKVEVTCAIKRFVFTDEAINNLRTLAKEEDDDNGASPKPTRYQVLSSFITKQMILAYNTKGIRSSLLLLIHIMDIRRRRGEPLNTNSMGNLLWPAMITYENKVNNPGDENNNTNISVNVNEVMKIAREKIGSIDKEFFLKIEREPEFLLSDECGGMLMEGMEKKKPIALVFSSWSNFGFKDLDFGMGKPLWVGYIGGIQETVPNSVIFIDTSQGIEAWISMPEEYLAVLEEDDEFLKYALLNPIVSSC